MSNILWVEDFGGGEVIATVDDVLGNIIETENLPKEKRGLRNKLANNGIILHLNFQDAITFINGHLNDIDYVILDIDLDVYGVGKDLFTDCPETVKILKEHYNLTDIGDENILKEALSKLKQHAGFHLYIELLFNHQYPREKILFCSNHGENLTTIQEAFHSAMMEMPPIYTKSDNKVKKLVQVNRQARYSILRRGIIDGCNFILQKLESSNKPIVAHNDQLGSSQGFAALAPLQQLNKELNRAIKFNHFLRDDKKEVSVQDMQSYLRVLSDLLPLQEAGQAEKENKFKLFIRTLSHEWERDLIFRGIGKDKELKAFVPIMKNTRNWVTHTNAFDHLDEHDLAFFFICNMRAMFDLGQEVQGYEKKLFSLFEPENINKTALANTMAENFNWMSSETSLRYSAADFEQQLKNFQRRKNPASCKLIQGLYQLFWFKTSPGKVQLSTNPGEVVYRFGINNGYQDKENFFGEFSRHIYSKSF